jgi:hypothetical protein
MNRTMKATLALTAAVALGACTNPVTPESHVSPTGFEILQNGQVVVAEQNGSLTGSLTLQAGQTLGPVTVRFRDGANVVAPDPSYFLEVAVANEAIVRFAPTTPGALTGSFQALSPGTTTMRVRWMHGRVGSPRAHHDYQSVPVPVIVTASSSQSSRFAAERFGADPVPVPR